VLTSAFQALPEPVRYKMPPKFKQIAMATGLRVYASIPGLRDGDIEITADGDRLRVTGRQACSVGPFHTEVQVPFGFDRANARAEYFSGELRIVLPRRYDS
jgi:HSP20 family molecular chaperone IbpA